MVSGQCRAEPKCEVVDCGPLSTPAQGRMTCDGTTFQKFCNFSCRKGFELKGSAKRQCGKDGFWTGKPAFCGTQRCEAQNDPVNGRIQCDGISFGSRCTTRCNKGYTLKGSAVRFCKGDNQWTGDKPECVPVKCEAPHNPTNGKAKCNGQGFGNVCEYTCEDGFELRGTSSVRRCKSNGHWSGLPPSCVPRDCGVLSSPPDGYMDCP